MRRDHEHTPPHSSGMKDADRIRLLLKEIWDVRESDDVEREPTLPRLWQELEYLVSQELDHKVTEELALHE